MTFLDFLFVISQMVAKGKDASDLFPPVVKNVVSKNLEVNILKYYKYVKVVLKKST